MIEVPITAAVRSAGPWASVIAIEGEVNGQAEETLHQAFTQASQKPARVVILNFAGLAYMNSAGIGLLVTLLIRAQREGLILAACSLNEHYREILSLTRLDEAIRVFPDETQAAAAALGAGEQYVETEDA